MLIWTARFSRKKAVATIIFFGLVMGILILLTGRSEHSATDLPQLTDNAARTSYLASLGWDVEPEPVETLQFLLPSALAEPYSSYNELQLAQGFDLSACCGKQVTRYTYAVTNYPNRPEGVQANLYVCEELPVAGDLFCAGEGGFQLPLIPSEAPQS